MMIVMSLFPLSSRVGDVIGSWPSVSAPRHGFLYCVAAITITYTLILPLILFVPKELISTADGEPRPVQESSMLAEIAKG